MNTASLQSFPARVSFLPSAPRSIPPQGPQEPQVAHRPAFTWWERLLLVLMRVLWLAGMGFGGVVVAALPAAQKPYLWQVCFFAAVLTILVVGLHWCVLFVIRGDNPAQDPRAKYARWAVFTIFFAVFTWFAKTEGFSNLVTTAKTPKVDEFAQFGGHANPTPPRTSRAADDEDNISFDDLIPKNQPKPTP